MKFMYFDELFEWKNPDDLYKVCLKQQEEIERLNNIINELEKSIKCECRTKLRS